MISSKEKQHSNKNSNETPTSNNVAAGTTLSDLIKLKAELEKGGNTKSCI